MDRTGRVQRQAVALALVEFCIEHNCFTRTLSSYELAKRTAGISRESVSRALTALATARVSFGFANPAGVVRLYDAA